MKKNIAFHRSFSSKIIPAVLGLLAATAHAQTPWETEAANLYGRELKGLRLSWAQAQSESAPPKAPTIPFAKIGLDLEKIGLDSKEPPALPVKEILEKVSANETLFNEALTRFSYTQKNFVEVLEVVDAEAQTTGGPISCVTEETPARNTTYHWEENWRVSMKLNSEGKWFRDADSGSWEDTPTFEGCAIPDWEQRGVDLSFKDEDHFLNMQAYPLVQEEANLYETQYLGQKRIEVNVERKEDKEIRVYNEMRNTFVFAVWPKSLGKRERTFFQGVIYVDQKEFQVIATRGKPVPDLKKGKNVDLYALFETYRIKKLARRGDAYWFPELTEGASVLRFPGGKGREAYDMGLFLKIEYTDYEEEDVKGRFAGFADEKPAKKPEEKQPKPQEKP